MERCVREHRHYKDLPKQVRKALSPADALLSTDVRETPEKNKARRKAALKKTK
jgi:hypothetical protein